MFETLALRQNDATTLALFNSFKHLTIISSSEAEPSKKRIRDAHRRQA
jgi:hypothetical protein